MPLKILHVISGIDPRHGGPTTALVALAHALKRAGVKVTLAATPRDSGHMETVQELLDGGVQIRLGKGRRHVFAKDPMLDSLLLEEISCSDVVHIHALWEDVQYRAASISRSLGKPFVIRPCGLLDPECMAQHGLRKRLYLEVRLRRYLDSASGIHYSTDIEEHRARSLGFKAPSIVEPNGLDIEEQRKMQPDGSFRAQWNIGEDTPVVLFLGRLHPHKGLDLLIPAFARGAPADAVLMIAGSGEPNYETSLRKNVVSLGLKDRVKFTGFLDGPTRNAAMAAATVFVLPSYSESFGNTVVESIASGTPVIVSDRVGLHTEVSSKKVGGVVPAGVDALAMEIEAWLKNDSKRESARMNSNHFLEQFDVKLVADRWVKRYQALCQPSCR